MPVSSKTMEGFYRDTAAASAGETHPGKNYVSALSMVTALNMHVMCV